jgi:hypothetical protein
MDEADLCRYKNAWLQTTFTIQTHPGERRIQEAAKRQRQRLGESYRVHDQNCSVNGG